MGTEEVRGVKCDRWDTQVQHPGSPGTTYRYTLSWFFTAKGWSVGGGETQIPFRAKLYGNVTNDSTKAVVRSFSHK